MALVKATLRKGIEDNLKLKLLQDPKIKQSLRKKLDGSVLNGIDSGANSLYEAYEHIRAKTEQILGFDYDPDGIVADNVEQILRKISSNENASAIADAVVEWMAEQIVPAIAAAVANNVDLFIRSATIITPAGQLTAGTSVAGGPTTGATTAPSAPAIIS